MSTKILNPADHRLVFNPHRGQFMPESEPPPSLNVDLSFQTDQLQVATHALLMITVLIYHLAIMYK